MRLLGLRHDVITKEDVKYLLFYDFDEHVQDDAIAQEVDMIMREYNISFIFYKTKHGYHLIGLTPLDAMQWANVFTRLKEQYPNYYGGIVIRISRKKEEVQELLQLEQNYGEVIPNLYNLYCTRFNLPKKDWKKEFAKYLLVFEKYRTEKE